MLHIKALGSELLNQCAEKSRLESNVVSNYRKRGRLEEIVKELECYVKKPEGHANIEYNGLGEAVARCFILYEKVPDAYAKLVGGICREEVEGFLDCFEGLSRLCQLCNGLSDDHDYVFNQHSSTIEIVSTTTAFHGLTPALFLQIVQGLDTDFEVMTPEQPQG